MIYCRETYSWAPPLCNLWQSYDCFSALKKFLIIFFHLIVIQNILACNSLSWILLDCSNLYIIFLPVVYPIHNSLSSGVNQTAYQGRRMGVNACVMSHATGRQACVKYFGSFLFEFFPLLVNGAAHTLFNTSKVEFIWILISIFQFYFLYGITSNMLYCFILLWEVQSFEKSQKLQKKFHNFQLCFF